MELPKNFDLVRMPPETELLIFLLRAELKNRKFLSLLEQAGFDSTFHSFDFGSLILKLVGITDTTDEVFEWYTSSLDVYAERVDLKWVDGELTKLALEFLMLIQQKKENLEKQKAARGGLS